MKLYVWMLIGTVKLMNFFCFSLTVAPTAASRILLSIRDFMISDGMSVVTVWISLMDWKQKIYFITIFGKNINDYRIVSILGKISNVLNVGLSDYDGVGKVQLSGQLFQDVHHDAPR